MQIIIFSKDRPAQLDLLLRSMKENFSFGYSLAISYRASDRDFANGYEKINFPQAKWYPQDDFKSNIKEICPESGFILNLCDDDVVINKLTAEDIWLAFDILIHYPRLKAYSLRLTPSSMYSFAHNRPMPVPNDLRCYRNFFVWDWTKQEKWSDWGYPHNLAGHIYRANYFRQLLRWSKPMSLQISRKKKVNWINWNSFNSLESAMARWTRKSTPLMAGFYRQILFNPAVNRTQTEWDKNRVGRENHQSLNALNQRFLAGLRIKFDPKKYQRYLQTGGDDIEFEFEKIESREVEQYPAESKAVALSD